MPFKNTSLQLSDRDRRVLTVLVPVICGRGAERSRVDPDPEPVMRQVEASLAGFSNGQRSAVLLGLRTFDRLAIFHRPFGRSFARLPPTAAASYYRSWWTSRNALARGVARLVRSLLVVGQYAQPTVQDELGYEPAPWIARTAERRLQLWSSEIARHEALLRAPDPLVPRPLRSPYSPVHQPLTNREFRGGQLDCDVVVVGSGAGGGVVAAELAEGGLDVIVLEEGGYHPTETFTPDATAMARKLYRDGGGQAALGTPAISFTEGRCIGGSTTVNGGMCWRTPEQVLARWSRDDGVEALRPEQLERYFSRVERFVSAAPQDTGSIGHDQELLRAGAERQGWEVIPNIRNQLHCGGCNSCIIGCPTGAKRSTLVSYLPRAMAFGARVFADCRVDRVTLRGTRAVGVSGHVLGADGRHVGRFSVRARHVVLAAGAIQTPGILLRSVVRSPSKRIGRNLSLHPNAAVHAIFDEPVEGWKGVHQAYQVRQFQEEGIIMAAINLPPPFLALAIDRYGAELAEAMGQYNRIVSAGVLVEDTATGRVRLLPSGRPAAYYSVSARDAATLVRGTALLAELLFAAGARRVVLPFQGMPDLVSADDARALRDTRVPRENMSLSTVHVMGTARMGADPARHVCDSYGRVYGNDGLTVADASLFPSPIGINPMETIMALATRNAEHILESWRN